MVIPNVNLRVRNAVLIMEQLRMGSNHLGKAGSLRLFCITSTVIPVSVSNAILGWLPRLGLSENPVDVVTIPP